MDRKILLIECEIFLLLQKKIYKSVMMKYSGSQVEVAQD